VFVVGHLGDWRRAAAVLFERESVFGNPPTRGKAWERVTGPIAGCSNGGGANGPGRTADDDDSLVWRAGDQANSEHCIDHAGTLNCDKGQQGGIVGIPDPAYAIAAGNQGKGGVFGSGRDSQDTFAVVAAYGFKQGANHSGACGGLTEDCEPPLTCGQDHNLIAFHPTQDPISSVDGSTHAMGCGSKGGCCTQAVAFQSNLGSHGGDVFEDGTSPTVRVGSGLGIPSPPAVAFKPSHFTRGKDGAPADVVAPLSADADKGDQDTVLAVPFTKSKRAQSTTDDETWVPGEVSPTMSCFDQGDTRATTVVAFAQNQLGEVRTNSEVMGAVNTNQNASGRNTPMVAFGCDDTMGTLRSNHRNNSDPKAEAGMHVMHGMAVRRLTPKECERLQGFPDGYTDVTYRGKPAADGPRYRALGNSMAVPVMAWIGQRIAEVEAMDGAAG
jgi:DNA (cytosine-5)-methyltransferase 1